MGWDDFFYEPYPSRSPFLSKPGTTTWANHHRFALRGERGWMGQKM
jgi:hypothetical protein